MAYSGISGSFEALHGSATKLWEMINAGKSSLLESITKCPVFPRGKAMTTRAPVCLRMEHIASSAGPCIEISFGDGPVETLDSEAAIADAVRERMERIPEGTVDSTVIHIRICKPGLPTMEVIDFPGIKEGRLKADIVGMISDYLALDETLVLCVVAVTYDLDSSQAIQLVREHRKEAKTIITLTKADILHPTQVDQQIIQRVLGAGEDITGFAGCVAVINRQHQDQVTLLEADDVELRMFRSRVFNSPLVHQLFTEQQGEVEQHISITTLIEQIVRLYCKHVQTVWRSQASWTIGRFLIPAQSDLDHLGPPPGEHLGVQQVLDHAFELRDWVQLAAILEGSQTISSCHSSQLQPQPMTLQLPHYSHQPIRQPGSDWLSNAADWLACAPITLNTLEHAEFLLQLGSAVRASIDHWIGQCWYVRDAQHAVCAAFAQQSHMRLERFSELREAVMSHLPHIISSSDMKQQVLFEVDPELNRLSSGWYKLGAPLYDALASLDRMVRFKVCQKFILPLKQGGLVQCVPVGFILREDPEYQAIRRLRESYLADLRKPLELISRFDQHVAAAEAQARAADEECTQSRYCLPLENEQHLYNSLEMSMRLKRLLFCTLAIRDLQITATNACPQNATML